MLHFDTSTRIFNKHPEIKERFDYVCKKFFKERWAYVSSTFE